MRDIKFRGHNGSKWIYSECIWFNEFPTLNDRMVCMYDEDDNYQEYLNIETWDSVSYLSQYIGLSDKNGSKIYEGDILKDSENKMYAIKWNNKNACFDTDDFYECGQDVPYDIFSEYAYSSMEVVGNIFENKDLLNKEE